MIGVGSVGITNKDMPYEIEQQAKEELKAMKRKCWTPDCKRKAWLEAWTGSRHCYKCWYKSMRWGGGNKWFFIRYTKIF